MARRRAVPGAGGLTRKTGTYTANGERRRYTYWQASREVPADARVAGTRKRVTGSGPTPAEAWRRCNANYDALVRGEPRRGKAVPSPRVTLRQAFEQWQATNEAGAVSSVMAGKYRGYFANHLLPHIGDRRLGSLTESDLTALFHRTLADKAHPTSGAALLSEASRRNIYMALSGCLQFAVRAGYLHHAAVGNVADQTESTHRRMRLLARECGLGIGMPVDLMGKPETYLDLRSGREEQLGPILKALAAVQHS